LVKADLEKGRATVDAIRARMPVHLAVWAHFPDAEEWRLLIVTPFVDREGPRAAYVAVQGATANLGGDALPIHRLVIVGPGDALAKMAADSLRSSGRVEGSVAVTTSSTSGGTVDVLYTDSKKGS